MIIRLKMWPLQCTQGFSKIWTGDLVLNRHDPFLNSYKIWSRQRFWPRFMIIGQKMWPLEHTQGFFKIWPSGLVFDLTWPIFEFVQYFIKANILTKFLDNQTENVASRAYTSQKVDDARQTQHYHNSSLWALLCSGELKKGIPIKNTLMATCSCCAGSFLIQVVNNSSKSELNFSFETAEL